MAELPKSWGLKTKKRSDGKLDIVGKDDLGKEYKARTTAGPNITDTDIAALREADRESYPDRATGARAYVNSLMAESKKLEDDRNNAFGDDMVEAAGHVSFGVLDRRGHSSPFTGSTPAYRRGWERIFGGN